jgi:thioredoxin 1
MMNPIIDELSKEIGDKIAVYKVDVDAEGALGNQYQIMSIPTILIFKDGEVVKQFNGVTGKEELREALED